MIGKTTADAAITASKIVVVLDHIKNNRIEYLVLVAIGHLIGATTYVRNYLYHKQFLYVICSCEIKSMLFKTTSEGIVSVVPLDEALRYYEICAT